jgi:putative DNA primase/helicase
MSAAFEAWKERARQIPIQDEIGRRGIRLTGHGKERVGPCPVCGGQDRFSINVTKQVFNCRGCEIGGDVIKLVEHLDKVDFTAACTTLVGEPPPPQGNGHGAKASGVVSKEYSYYDCDGHLVFAVDRIEEFDGVTRKKTFRQKRPDPEREERWLYNIEGVQPIPYKLFTLTEAIADEQTVFIVEGEKCVDALVAIGVRATTNAGGAGKWRDELTAYFKDADVVLVPDNDDAGWQHINKVGAALTGVAKRIRVLVLPDLRTKGDVVDWLAAGGTREKFDALAAEALDWQKPDAEKIAAEASEKKLIDRLAALGPIDYDRQRKEAAESLNIRSSTLDDAVEARRAQTKEAVPLHGHWVNEPWPEPVEGDSLLRNIIMRIRRHVVCSHDDALTVALWLMMSWVHDEVATHSPILNVTSAEPESGKSTTLGIVALLAPRCISTVEISEAALYRAIKLWSPSFAIDEFDSVLANTEDKTGLRSAINSGHTRGQGVVRCVGDEKTPELFPTFAPKAIGMVGRKLPAATLSRCIFVALKRKKGNEEVERFEHKDDKGLSDLRSRLLRWSMDSVEVLLAAAPAMPEGLKNRRADNWRLMLAIADLAGEDWGEKTRKTIGESEKDTDSRTANVKLLAAIQAIMLGVEEAVIGSAELIEKLTADPASDWAEWSRGKPLSQKQLANMLKPFGIGADRARVEGHRIRGYLRSQFEDAWERYL